METATGPTTSGPAGSPDATDPLPTALQALAEPDLDPLFWPASRAGVVSAWAGHVPFAHWLVAATAPRRIVELGTHTGVSYAAFCEAVLRRRLACRCTAVDTWLGDSHAGLYGEDVFTELRAFHDPRYGAFSDLSRSTFAEALARVEDASIDLLHIDGLHTYEAVRADFESWLPKLTDRAVVLFHDTEVRTGDFGVWRLWAELSARHPAFAFEHGFGLGVLLVGPDAPRPARALCALAGPAADQVRARFAALGARWQAEMHLTFERTRAEAAMQTLRQERDAALDRERSTAATLAAIVESTTWRATGPLRRLLARVRNSA